MYALKHFLKVFSVALLCFILAVGAGVFTYVKFYNAEAAEKDPADTASGKEDDNKSDEEEIKDPLQRAISKSKRVNFLLLGMEGPRTDTIMFASFDTKSKKVDMISIPRDTYYYRKGHESADARKINAVYGNDGIDGIKNAVQKVLGDVPIEHYVMVDYKGVAKIVDALGGVEVNVPFHMEYRDTTAGQPPLYIDIPKGKQVLDGKQAVKFLRWRHNNDMTVGYPDGDLGRIKAQQQFVASAIKKSLSLKLPNVIKACFTYVKTDVGLSDALVYAANALGIDMENISMTTLPGDGEYKTIKGTRLSYFTHNPDKIKDMMMELYDVKIEENTEN